MAQAPIVLDANWLIDEFSRYEDLKGLSKKFKRMLALHSISVDLEDVTKCLKLVSDEAATFSEDGSMKEDQALRLRAIVSYAVIAYSRCTDTSSDSRSSYDPRRYLDEGQRIVHKSIIDLRNEALAHFGSGNHAGGSWAGDQLKLHVDTSKQEAGWSLSSSRANFRGKVLEDLASLLPAALGGLREDQSRLSALIFAEMDHHAPVVSEIMGRCPHKENDIEGGAFYYPRRVG